MATVDIAYREWLTRFKEANPTIADNPTVLEVIRITWDASKKAARAKHKEAAPMADVELLPLPSSLDAWFVQKMEAYARANIAHATAAKDAEIEALRAEVRELRERIGANGDESTAAYNAASARAERLEKTLGAYQAAINRIDDRIEYALPMPPETKAALHEILADLTAELASLAAANGSMNG